MIFTLYSSDGSQIGQFRNLRVNINNTFTLDGGYIEYDYIVKNSVSGNPILVDVVGPNIKLKEATILSLKTSYPRDTTTVFCINVQGLYKQIE
jgi:hypothetical protein